MLGFLLGALKSAAVDAAKDMGHEFTGGGEGGTGEGGPGDTGAGVAPAGKKGFLKNLLSQRPSNVSAPSSSLPGYSFQPAQAAPMAAAPAPGAMPYDDVTARRRGRLGLDQQY